MYMLILLLIPVIVIFTIYTSDFSLPKSSLLVFSRKFSTSILLLHLLFIPLSNIFSTSIRVYFMIVNLTLILISDTMVYLLTYVLNCDLKGALITNDIFLINNYSPVVLFNWNLNLLSFFFDNISLLFSITTLVIGVFVITYSNIYLSLDKNKVNFIQLLNVFILSMLFIVKTNSMLVFILC